MLPETEPLRWRSGPLRAEVARVKVRQEVDLEIADQVDDFAAIIRAAVVPVEPDLLEYPQ